MKRYVLAGLCSVAVMLPWAAHAFFGNNPPAGLYIQPISTTWDAATVSVIDHPPGPSGCFGGGGTNYFNVSQFLLADPAGDVVASSVVQRWPYNFTSTFVGLGFARPSDGAYQLIAKEGEWAPCGTWYDLWNDEGMGWFSFFGGHLVKMPGPPAPALGDLGLSVSGSAANFHAMLASSSTDPLELQIEVRSSDAEFVNAFNLTSTPVMPGVVASLGAPALPGGSYHWQARVHDIEDSLSSQWQEGGSFTIPRTGTSTAVKTIADSAAVFSCENGFIGPRWNLACGSVSESSSSSFIISDIILAGDQDLSANNHADPPDIFMTIKNSDGAVIATSTNTCRNGYSACGGFDFTFDPVIIPEHFSLSMVATVLQGNTYEIYSGATVFARVPGPLQGVRNPVVIVPGVFGSERKGGYWILQPRLAPYAPLLDTLLANGYVRDKTLFDFPYDWRQSNLVSARKLKEKIGAVKAACGCAKVDIVAHSMGGLVARAYMESDWYGSDIDRIVFLGVPQEGSPDSYFAWEGGTGNFKGAFDLTTLYMKSYLYQEAVEAGFPFADPRDGTIFKYIHADVPSISELLPAYDYLREASSGMWRKYPEGNPRNSLLEDLNSSSSLAAFAMSGAKTVTMYSDDQTDTTAAIKVQQNQNALPLWTDGVPRTVESGAGDGTVPAGSATFLGDEAMRIGGKHFDLPSSAAGKVVTLLEGIADPKVVPPSPVANFLSILAFSPVHISITAPSGERMGYETDEIDGAFYSGSDTAGENIFIADPAEGTYELIVQGSDDGPYHLLAQNASSESVFAANVRPGVTEKLEISGADGMLKITPLDTAPPQISHTLLDRQYVLHATAMSFFFSAADATGLLYVSSTLDGNPLASGERIAFDLPGRHTVTVAATDLLGNATSVALDYDVIYRFGGFLPPLKAGGSYNDGRTIPVKFQLKDAGGKSIGTAKAQAIVNGAKTGDLFRYDSSSEQYIYNLRTEGLALGQNVLRVALDDGTMDSINIFLR